MSTKNLEVDILDTVEFDDEGFLVDAMTWSPELAEEIADVLGISLREGHWIVINYARAFYLEAGESPTLRQIVTNTGVTMKEIYQLFPGGPAKIAAKIAGLRKPTGCI